MSTENCLTTIKKRLALLAVGVSMALVFACAAIAADYVVVTSKEVSAGSLSKDDVQAIFLGDKTRWNNGEPIKIAVLEAGGAHKDFLRDVLHKTPSQYYNYWRKMVFTGKAAAPKSFKDAQSLIDFVSGQSNAVGYVAANEANGSVKIISIKEENIRK